MKLFDSNNKLNADAISRIKRAIAQEEREQFKQSMHDLNKNLDDEIINLIDTISSNFYDENVINGYLRIIFDCLSLGIDPLKNDAFNNSLTKAMCLQHQKRVTNIHDPLVQIAHLAGTNENYNKNPNQTYDMEDW